MSIRSVLMVLLLAYITTACASAPVQEMSDARQAVEAAQRMEAGVHAPALLQEAQAHIRHAEEALAAGDYDVAREAAVAARTRAIEARAKAVAAGRAR